MAIWDNGPSIPILPPPGVPLSMYETHDVDRVAVDGEVERVGEAANECALEPAVDPWEAIGTARDLIQRLVDRLDEPAGRVG